MMLSDHLRDAVARIRAGGVDHARLTAEVLLVHVLGLSRAQMLARLERDLGEAERARFEALVGRAAAGEPLAYLTGQREFFGLDFEVTPDVLVPRPETELLVERALAMLGAGSVHVVDVGTGSGIIAVTVAARRPLAHVTALDVSPAALTVARRNAERLGVAERVRFRQQDLLDPAPEAADLICANLPYIPAADLATLDVSRHEPRLALDGGPDGLDLIRRLVAQAVTVLAAQGGVLLEIEARQGPAVETLCASAFPGASIEIVRDLAGLDRVVQVRRAITP